MMLSPAVCRIPTAQVNTTSGGRGLPVLASQGPGQASFFQRVAACRHVSTARNYFY